MIEQFIDPAAELYLPDDVRHELYRVASSNGRISVEYLIAIYRCGRAAGKSAALTAEPPALACAGCAGRGVVGGYEPTEFGNTLSAYPVDVPCPDCKGSGDVPPLPTAAPAPVDRQCAVCRAIYPQEGQHAGTTFALSVAGRPVCKRCVNAGKDARIADEAALAPSPETVSVSRGQLHAWLDNIVNASRDIDAGHATTALLRLVVRRIEADIAALSPPETAPKGGQ